MFAVFDHAGSFHGSAKYLDSALGYALRVAKRTRHVATIRDSAGITVGTVKPQRGTRERTRAGRTRLSA